MSDYAETHKIPAYQVRHLTNADPEFYVLVGPLLSRREIVAEIGGPVWDDDDKEWALAAAGDRVLGLCAVRGSEVCSFYVVPGSRGQSVGYALLRTVLDRSPHAVKATASKESQSLFALMGFAPTGTRGRFTTMRREAEVSV